MPTGNLDATGGAPPPNPILLMQGASRDIVLPTCGQTDCSIHADTGQQQEVTFVVRSATPYYCFFFNIKSEPQL